MADSGCTVLNYSWSTENISHTESVAIESLTSPWFSPSPSKVGPYTVSLSTCWIVHSQLKLCIVHAQQINWIYLHLFVVILGRKYKYFDVRTPQLRVIEAVLGIYHFLFHNLLQVKRMSEFSVAKKIIIINDIWHELFEKEDSRHSVKL